MERDSDFRFSPRPNRAAEIRWRPWGEPAFAEARKLGRPVLLSVSAVWCHWCHVMDETSYSDARVIAAINEHFVPVRVDNDRHPDVNRRYNMGGWPTTAFLAASGDVLTGGTYLPPDQMLESLARVKAFFDANQSAIVALEAERARAGDSGALANLAGVPVSREQTHASFEGDPDVPGDISAEVALQIVRGFDPLHGGLGTEPKFPQPDVFGFMLAYGLLRGTDQPEHTPEGPGALLRPARVHEVVRATLQAMATSDLYDHVAGGFFRYSTQRDWSVPHYEKMLEDNARLAWLYLEASLHAGAHDLGAPDLFRRAGEGTIDYLLATLWRDDVPAFAGSQDADEDYYLLDADGRAGLPDPFVDPTVYVDWNALAARALLRAAPILERPELTDHAVRLLDYLLHRPAAAKRWRTSCCPTAGVGDGAPLLGDQAGIAAASSTPTRSPANGAGCDARAAWPHGPTRTCAPRTDGCSTGSPCRGRAPACWRSPYRRSTRTPSSSRCSCVSRPTRARDGCAIGRSRSWVPGLRTTSSTASPPRPSPRRSCGTSNAPTRSWWSGDATILRR